MQNDLVLVERLCDAMEVYYSRRGIDTLWYYDWTNVALAFGRFLERRKHLLENAEPPRPRPLKWDSIRG